MKHVRNFGIVYFIIAMLWLAASLVPAWSDGNHRLFGIWLADVPTGSIVALCALILYAGVYHSERGACLAMIVAATLILLNLLGVVYQGDHLSRLFGKWLAPAKNFGQADFADNCLALGTALVLIITCAATACRKRR